MIMSYLTQSLPWVVEVSLWLAVLAGGLQGMRPITLVQQLVWLARRYLGFFAGRAGGDIADDDSQCCLA